MTATPAPVTTAPPSALRSARFYITSRRNSLCGYCNVWQDDKFKGYEELTPDPAREILDQLHEIGVRYVDFTGGEPVLHPHIDEIVQYAKSLGMAVEITSNGIRFAKRIDAIVPYVDTMNVSLDTLKPDRYRAERGRGGGPLALRAGEPGHHLLLHDVRVLRRTGHRPRRQPDRAEAQADRAERQADRPRPGSAHHRRLRVDQRRAAAPAPRHGGPGPAPTDSPHAIRRRGAAIRLRDQSKPNNQSGQSGQRSACAH
ncbi:radical SAM protein [Streptomyces sp. NPDC048441]|uniref:radical SAM protein n=1 Tax=Streptomyces sp. NPDC048441 TaxID=3365552 RepID=UPI003719DF9C